MLDKSEGDELWRELSPDDLEREYSPSSCIGGNYVPFVTAYTSRSRDARSHCIDLGATWQSISYGHGPARRLHLCMPSAHTAGATAKPGLLIFIHGGYWQELSAEDSLFPATGCIQNGVAFAAINYTLAPSASLPDMVAECRQAVSWLFWNAEALGMDAHRIVVAGSSAGAHLAAMAALPDSDAEKDGNRPPLLAVVLVSGIFALEPLVGTSINMALGLSEATARELSPALIPTHGFPDALVCWGANETIEFKRQSRDFASMLAAGSRGCDVFEVTHRNHFDVIMDLADSSTELGRKTLALVNSAPR